jgi:hypothetical protein
MQQNRRIARKELIEFAKAIHPPDRDSSRNNGAFAVK